MNVMRRRAVLLLRSSFLQWPANNNPRRATLQNFLIDNHLEKKEYPDKVVSVVKNKSILSEVDVEEIDDVAPAIRPTFNIAAYANKSATLQELIKLGVDLSKWEKSMDVWSHILTLDFNKHMKQHITFLHDIGVAADDLGRWLTINPLIFKENIDDLQTRINYLSSKNFDQLQISRIISCNPKWLLFSTVEIDEKLGFFQKTFGLTNNEVRLLTTKQPRLITYKLYAIKRANFAILEEMGFTEIERKKLLLAKPRIWMAHGVSLMRRFDYVHNEMGLSHSQIVQFPKILLTRDFKIKERHSFLKLINRNQYDCLKPNYVSPDALIEGDDVEFCTNVAKTSILDFNNFLKTY